MAERPRFDVETVIGESSSRRSSETKRRSRMALGVSTTVTVVWLIYVTASGQWGRVGDQWASAVTMVFGSFVAGSTPQGGGAVAFPVFTKVLDVPSEVARTFSLTIQSIGMTAASLNIIINRRRVDFRAISLAAPASLLGFLIGYFLLTETDRPFGPSVLPGAYVKVTFTVIVAAMAFVTYVGYRNQLIERRVEIPRDNARVTALIIVCGLIGGVASLLVGSGSDVFVYLAVVSMIGLSPRVGVASSVIVMTLVSLLGVVLLAIGDGHLTTQLAADGESVVLVGDQQVTFASGQIDFGTSDPRPEASRFDLFGLWLAAAPVVAWGAPLGSLVSSKATDRQVVKFVIFLAALEFVSTLIFLDELRSDGGLVLFGLLMMTGTFVVLLLATRNRHRLLRLPSVDLERSVTRGAVDIGPKIKDQLRGE